MAGRGVFSWSVAVLLVGMVAGAAAATQHVVGGTATGWTIPPNATFYSEWAASQTFVVGDSLVFNFTTGAHNVIEVRKSDYDACTSKNKIGSTITKGPATVTISSAGQHFYICGVPGHCSGAGQKLAITVTGSSTTEQAPTTAPSGAAPGGSTPTTTPSPESAPGPSATKGSSSATSLASSLPMAVVFSLAFGFLI
ncbi:putative Phytocyanin domain, cupredoxin [Dioscorea sansibarensis]